MRRGGIPSSRRTYSLECEPSQNGLPALRLHPHNHTFWASATVNFTGSIPLPLWEPSQNGWRLDWPHAHHQ
jgi:hypothetical protein